MNDNILKEDKKQYSEILECYENMGTADIELAFEIAQKSIILADRWNEIMLQSAKLCLENGTSKTSFEKWAYHRYRVLMTIHEFCRVVWRQGQDSLKNGFYNEM